MRFDHCFYTVGNEFPGRKAVFHSAVSHGDSVVDSNGVELERNSTGSPDGILYNFTEGLQVDMSGNDIRIGIDNSNKGFFEIFFLQPNSAQKGPVWCFFKTFFNSIASHLSSLSKITYRFTCQRRTLRKPVEK